MTTPTAAKRTPAKSTSAKETPVVETPEEIKETQETPETPEETNQEVNRIPDVLSENAILADFCRRYLEIFDEITQYNKEVLSTSNDEWTPGKVLEKSRELGRPAQGEPNKEVKAALETYEELVNNTAKARRALLDITANAIGITLSATAVRDPETEAPLREKRKFAITLGDQLATISKLTTDESASAAVTEFLKNSPLPAIGRDQTRTFGEDVKATPKYRVTVTVSRDGNVLVSEDGFTKTGHALVKLYERGKAPKSDTLRTAWENAGNTPEKTVTNPVEFDDNGLHYVISKKN